MPIWSEILTELHHTADDSGFKPDEIRRKYLVKLHQETNRSVILYAAAWIQRPDANPNFVGINDEDIQALMEVSYQLGGKKLDLILHSPGGSIAAAEAIVSYLRSRFTDIRVIVPQIAMSAATMIACAANTVVLGKHSSLGPIDPQIVIPTALGTRMIAAQHVLNQFDRAKQECADSANLAAWMPILSQYGPDLLAQCESVLEMAQELVEEWLNEYMFQGEKDSESKAENISNWLAAHDNFKSHDRHISRKEVEKHGLKIVHLENDQQMQDLVLSVYHATTHTFGLSTAVKIVENHNGRAFVKTQPHPTQK